METPKTGSVVPTLLILPIPLHLVSRCDTDSCNTEPSRARKSDTQVFRNMCSICFQQVLVANVNAVSEVWLYVMKLCSFGCLIFGY
jgi:hypothetical protein